MNNDQQLGLDELMIVNPGPSAPFFLGEDGTLYQVQGLEGCQRCGGAATCSEVGEDSGRELAQYFLGDDGALYEVVK